MANFVRHTSCPSCGSSDANGIYDDGSSFCFSCRRTSRGNLGDLFKRVAADATREVARISKSLPDDCTPVLSGAAWEWVSKYGFTAEVLLKNNVVYSPSRNQVIFTWPEYPNFWTTRNFWHGAKSKAFHNGEVNDVLTIYSQGESGTICLVEDCLSSIKCSYVGVDSMPVLGSAVSPRKLSRVGKRYNNLIVWLDHDKGGEAHKIARRGGLLGMQTRVIHTELDPKEYSYEQLKEYL